jgi:hypothetical protein
METSEATAVECPSAVKMRKPAAESAVEAPKVMEAMEPPKAAKAVETSKATEAPKTAKAVEPAKATKTAKAAKTAVKAAKTAVKAPEASMEAPEAAVKSTETATAKGECRIGSTQAKTKAQHYGAEERRQTLSQYFHSQRYDKRAGKFPNKPAARNRGRNATSRVGA